MPALASTDDVLAFWGEFPEKPTWYSLWPSAMVNTFLRKAGWINTGPLTKREEIPHDALMNEDFMRELFTIPPFHDKYWNYSWPRYVVEYLCLKHLPQEKK